MEIVDRKFHCRVNVEPDDHVVFGSGDLTFIARAKVRRERRDLVASSTISSGEFVFPLRRFDGGRRCFVVLVLDSAGGLTSKSNGTRDRTSTSPALQYARTACHAMFTPHCETKQKTKKTGSNDAASVVIVVVD